jgi:hypothetical protein
MGAKITYYLDYIIFEKHDKLNLRYLMKYITLFVCLIALFIIGCENSNTTEKYKQETLEMESLEQEMDASLQEIDNELEDMSHDVDSLLEGI